MSQTKTETETETETETASEARREVLVLDGGMGRELKDMGAPFRQPEWSALALMEAPELVRKAHERYVEAGAQVLTTNAYAVVPFHIGEERFREQGAALARKAAQLAREAASKGSPTAQSSRPRVAASVPPVFGSYRPDLFDEARAADLWPVVIDPQAPLCDLFLAETMSSVSEAKLAVQLCAKHGKPIWVACALEDHRAVLRSGESVAEFVRGVQAADKDGLVEAVLFNCSQMEVMEPAIREAVSLTVPHGTSYRIGVYANAFCSHVEAAVPAANETLCEIRDDITPELYAEFARRWVDAGVTIVGGCCGVGPAHIAELCRSFGSGRSS